MALVTNFCTKGCHSVARKLRSRAAPVGGGSGPFGPCTEKFAPPPTPGMMKNLRKWIFEHIEVFSADAANDEQLAGKLLQDGPMPNIKFLIKDTAHAARRISQRTAKLDPYCTDVQERYYLGKGSIARLIQHSRIFSNRFQMNNSMDEVKHGGGRIKNLRAVKHRLSG